jgi:hypothetical protein
MNKRMTTGLQVRSVGHGSALVRKAYDLDTKATSIQAKGPSEVGQPFGCHLMRGAQPELRIF